MSAQRISRIKQLHSNRPPGNGSQGGFTNELLSCIGQYDRNVKIGLDQLAGDRG